LPTPVDDAKSETEKRIERERKQSGGSQRKAALVVGLVFVGVAAALVAMNFDRLYAVFAKPQETEPEVVETPAPNTMPVILSVTSASDRIEPSDLSQVVCEAEDADGDSLTYAWTASQGEVVGEGPTVDWNAPDTEGLYQLSVTVDDGRGGSAEFSTSVRVKKNYAPEIVELTSFSDWAMPETSVYVSALATDLDADEVSYEWSATAGEVFGQGRSIVWVAPVETGSYLVKVTVRDTYGGVAEREIPISVTPGTAPTLGRFRVTGIQTDMLKLYNGVWDVFMGRSVNVQCNVTEGEGPFTYTWSVDRGELTADGDTARWDAPETKGPATITVNVTDVHGNTTVGTVLMNVETCTCQF
jgi:hypothetical protein